MVSHFYFGVTLLWLPQQIEWLGSIDAIDAILISFYLGDKCKITSLFMVKFLNWCDELNLCHDQNFEIDQKNLVGYVGKECLRNWRNFCHLFRQKPKNFIIELISGEKLSASYFNFKRMEFKLLQNSDLMKDYKFIDRETFQEMWQTRKFHVSWHTN